MSRVPNPYTIAILSDISLSLAKIADLLEKYDAENEEKTD